MRYKLCLPCVFMWMLVDCAKKDSFLLSLLPPPLCGYGVTRAYTFYESHKYVYQVSRTAVRSSHFCHIKKRTNREKSDWKYKKKKQKQKRSGKCIWDTRPKVKKNGKCVVKFISLHIDFPLNLNIQMNELCKYTKNEMKRPELIHTNVQVVESCKTKSFRTPSERATKKKSISIVKIGNSRCSNVSGAYVTMLENLW